MQKLGQRQGHHEAKRKKVFKRTKKVPKRGSVSDAQSHPHQNRIYRYRKTQKLVLTLEEGHLAHIGKLLIVSKSLTHDYSMMGQQLFRKHSA
jgi:hypothetical protein